MLVKFLSPVLGHKVLYSMPMLSPHDQGGRPWNPLLLLTGPRSSSLMTPWVPGSLASCCLFPAVVLGRCNRQGPIKKSPSEGETGINMVLELVHICDMLKLFAFLHTHHV